MITGSKYEIEMETQSLDIEDLKFLISKQTEQLNRLQDELDQLECRRKEYLDVKEKLSCVSSKLRQAAMVPLTKVTSRLV